MDVTPALAEVTGVLLGDGCLSKYWANYDCRFRHEVQFTGNIDELEYYAAFVRPVFRNSFGVEGRIHLRKNSRSLNLHFVNRSVFEFFSSLGVPIGEKSSIVRIPPVIFGNLQLRTACIRGLWDAEGSVFRRYRKQYARHPRLYGHYLVLQIKMISREIISQIDEGLRSLSIRPAKISREKSGAFVLRITDQVEIQKFLVTVGFRNVHHLNRLARFRAEGI